MMCYISFRTVIHTLEIELEQLRVNLQRQELELQSKDVAAQGLTTFELNFFILFLYLSICFYCFTRVMRKVVVDG